MGLLSSALDALFGVVILIVVLAVLATVPFAQVLSLGYLLEVSGRIARSGRVLDGFVGVRKAARLGRIALGVLLLMIPLWVSSSLRYSSQLIDPNSRATATWNVVVVVIAALVLFQIVTGCLRGAKLRHFVIPRPWRSLRLAFRPGAYAASRDATWDFVAGLRLPYYAWLGARGFVGAFVWLVLPVTLLSVASFFEPELGTIVGLMGGLLLAAVLLYLPFLQARFAAEDRFWALFEIGEVRGAFNRAPVACWIALFSTLALTLPLYLLKIEIVPREAAWLPSLLFVVSIFPARFMVGWALGRARQRLQPRNQFVCWMSRLAMLPVVAIYVVVVYFSQYLSWYGHWSLYEQHAFLVPAPFLGY